MSRAPFSNRKCSSLIVNRRTAKLQYQTLQLVSFLYLFCVSHALLSRPFHSRPRQPAFSLLSLPEEAHETHPHVPSEKATTVADKGSTSLMQTGEIVLESDDFLRFGGVGRLYQGTTQENSPPLSTQTVLDRLSKATVAVIGLGGVGSWAAEALCRSGVGHLIMMDLDDICISNTNRQLHTTSNTIGKLKIEALKDRFTEIHPNGKVTLIHDFVTQENVRELVQKDFLRIYNVSIVLDAIDGGTEKTALLAACAEFGLPILTCGGAAGLTDPTKIMYSDLSQAGYDHLLSSCRRTLRREYGFARGVPLHQQIKQKISVETWNIEAVYSKEDTKSVDVKDTSSFRLCDGALGTACFVTGTFGFVAASRVIRMIVENRLIPPTCKDATA